MIKIYCSLKQFKEWKGCHKYTFLYEFIFDETDKSGFLRKGSIK